MFGFSLVRWLRSVGRRKSQPVRKRPSRYRLSVEALETRLAPATYTWSGTGADNNWTTNANWGVGSLSHPTGANDDIIFPVLAVGSYTSNNNLNNALIHSIDFQGTGYNINGNAITLGT